MTAQPYEGPERRESPHEVCVAHSGMNVKLNINVFLGGVGILLLSTLLALVIETNSTVKVSSARLEQHDALLGKLDGRVTALELSNARCPGHQQSDKER